VEEGLAHESLVCGEVAVAGLGDDIGGKLGRLGFLIPTRLSEPVANKLLVI
jgi:hypothetical protein